MRKSKSKKQKKSSKPTNVAAEVSLIISQIVNRADPVDMPSTDDVYKLLATEGSREAVKDVLHDIELKLANIVRAIEQLNQAASDIRSSVYGYSYAETLEKIWASIVSGAGNISNEQFNEIKTSEIHSSVSFTIPSVVGPETEIGTVQTVNILLGPNQNLLDNLRDNIRLAYSRMLGESGLVLLTTIANTLRIVNSSTELLSNISQELATSKVMLELLNAKFSNLTLESEQLNDASPVKWL